MMLPTAQKYSIPTMNTPRLITGCLVLASLMGLAPNLVAQSTAFTYQGRLDDGGYPASGIYDLRFGLFAAPTAGVQQGVTLTQTATAVSNGLFTVTLDFGNQFPGADRWLETAVRTNGGGAFSTLAPRQALTPTPYAMFAGKVNASGITGTLAPGNIANGTITTLMLANGAVGSNQLAAGAVTTPALANGAVTATKVATVSNWFALTIANPTPENNDNFGNAVAALGNDRLLIGAGRDATGAPDAGSAYLFSTHGTLLTTFTNPTPAIGDLFGNAVAAVGNDLVLIVAPGDGTGAADAGAAYLFRTNGTLLTTFTNPTPAIADLFGNAVAAVGSDRVLIGASRDNTGAADAGAVYLFSTSGTLLNTFTNPTPAINDLFGHAVAVLGSDRVLISALFDNTGATSAGAAYLFSTNGTLLTTFTNPTPEDFDDFGNAVAAVGSDRVLIGARGDATGAAGAGAAYLFRTNGTLLTTFTNPTPALSDQFGNAVAAVGSDRVLIGASRDDTGAADAGVVYLFSTNGTLLNTFTKPTPAISDLFGNAVAAMGSDRVLISAFLDDTGASGAGAAYLFSTETFTDGLVADAVRARSVTTASLEDGAVTAAKISGVLFPSQIPGLDASTIVSGTLNTNRIPNLDASKITSGSLADARLSTNVAFRNTPQTLKRLTVSGAGAFDSANAAAIILDNTTAVTGRRWEWHALDNGKMQLADFDAAATRLVVDTAGNVGIGTASPNAPLQVIGEVRATVFTPTSDRHAKENFAPVNPAEVLQKVAALPITEWSYKTIAGARHVGPMAQDFHAAFGLGSDDKGISTVDADGVALAAIQGLNQKLELTQRENAALKERVERLEKLLRKLAHE